MATLQAAEDYYRTQALLSVAAARQAARAWSQVAPENVDAWSPVRLATFVAATQLAAVSTADAYTDAALSEQNVDTDAAGRVRSAGFVGVAGDGRSLVTLLDQARIGALVRIGQGMGAVQSLAQAGRSLQTYAASAVQDAGRGSSSVSLVAHPGASGYVRMLTAPSCSRCSILAGRVYRWNAGFSRHPRCDCTAVAVSQDTAGDLTTDPRLYFDSLSATDQNRTFTKAGAEAIRDGADMGQVVNARRGANGMAPAGARLTGPEVRMLRGGRDRGRLEPVSIGGRQVFTTTEGATRRGVAGKVLGAGRSDATKTAGERYRRARRPRLMPETIYGVAEDRADALRLLRANGYLT